MWRVRRFRKETTNLKTMRVVTRTGLGRLWLPEITAPVTGDVLRLTPRWTMFSLDKRRANRLESIWHPAHALINLIRRDRRSRLYRPSFHHHGAQ